MTVRFYTTSLLATDAYEAIKLSNNISSNQKNKKQKTKNTHETIEIILIMSNRQKDTLHLNS